MLFERVHGEQRWENEPAAGWTVADLDGSEIVRTVEEAIHRGRAADPGTRESNELLRVLYRRGIIETWGRGTIKMAELVKLAGLPPRRSRMPAGA